MAAAQQTTATLSGTVTDQSGATIAGARILILQLDTGAERETTADYAGRYVAPRLPVGPYEIRVEREGFQTGVRRGLELTVGRHAVVDFVLPVGEARFEVTVFSDAPLVDTQSAELSYLVGSRTIEELPINGRNYLDLALLQPGVQPFRNRDSGGSAVAHGLGASVNGQDPRSNVYLLDGALQNDFTNGPAGSTAGTSLGMDTIREFRVEANSYSAEFGRNFGGQINALTKSGGNAFHGSAFWYSRNDNLDARNFFDPSKQPEFRRNQFGGTLGGPIKQGQTFFFFGYEGLREDLGRTISSVSPDQAARRGFLPNDTGDPLEIGVDPLVQPYLDEYPLPNGRSLGGGLGVYNFGFNEKLDQDFFQGRLDHSFSDADSVFLRWTVDDADQLLPTDFPQFPREFISRNQFATLEHQRAFSASMLNTARVTFSRTPIGQNVQANTSRALDPFVPGLPSLGEIDIGGLPRFGPQTSGDLRLTQNVYGFHDDFIRTRGPHTLKLGGLLERYQDNLFNPTFARGIQFFSNLEGFLRNQPIRYIGLTPDSTIDRYWRFNLLGLYVQDDWRASSRLSLNLGLRYEYAAVPGETQGRNTALISIFDAEPTVGKLYSNPTAANLAPRFGFAYDVSGTGRTAVRGGYGLFFNTNNQQNLIVTVVNPPAASRPVIIRPTFPRPSFGNAADRSIRPIEYQLNNPYIQSWNLNVQHEAAFSTLVTIGYAGSRGIHLLRNTDANTAIPTQLSDGRWFYAADAPLTNPNFSTIELKKSDGRSWYNALIFEVRKRFSQGLQFQTSYTYGRSIDTGQASTFFSDSRTGTTSSLPELPGFEYNKGLSDFHAKHNLVANLVYEIPSPWEAGWARAVFGGWRAGGILTVQSGNPITSMVQLNRSRSRWAATVGAGRGVDRPQLAPGFTHETAVTGDPDRWFNPAAFELQEAGFLGALGRNTFIGPNLRAFDFSLAKSIALRAISENARLQFRAEMFNSLNRANFAAPAILAFAGVRDGERPLGSFGRVSSTVTSARQIQLGLRLAF